MSKFEYEKEQKRVEKINTEQMERFNAITHPCLNLSISNKLKTEDNTTNIIKSSTDTQPNKLIGTPLIRLKDYL
jgi:hypothetical protein